MGRNTSCRVATGIVSMPRIFNVNFALWRISPAKAPGACRDHAVEHVHTAPHRVHDVARLTNTHEITRFVFWQQRDGVVEHFEHCLLPFAHRKPADCVAIKTNVDESLG